MKSSPSDRAVTASGFPFSFLIGVLCLQLGTAAAADITLTHGPILGRLGADEIGIWGRTSEPGSFQVRFGTGAGNLDQLSDPVQTRLQADNTGWVHLRGLQPDTKYYYEVLPEGAQTSRREWSGSFRTLPDSEQVRDAQHNPRGLFNFSFEFACGNHQPTNLQLPAFKTMLERLDDRIHFAILNGDWLYEEKRDYPVSDWLGQVRRSRDEIPRTVQIAPTIVGVWENYKLYLTRGRNLAAWHREIPSFFTFDDHEILDDVNGTGSVGYRSRRAVFRDIGVEAWYHYLGWSNPIPTRQRILFGRARLEAGSPVLLDAEADFGKLDLEQAATLMVHWGGPTAGVSDFGLDVVGGDPNAGVYEVSEVLDRHRLRIRPAPSENGEVSYSIGQLSYFRTRVANTEFFFLDTRGHRQLHDIRDPFKEGVSMIGDRQKAWLKRGMSESEADFLFVVSSVNLMVPHVSTLGNPDKDEAWTAIAAEREELIDFWDSLNKPVLVLTGDLHNSFAIKITDRVWEFASGPHNSGNHPARAESNRPPNGPFESRGRKAEIRWSTYFLDDSPAPRRQPVYCVVQVNNVFQNRAPDGGDRWVAFPWPQVLVQYYDGLSGDLLYAEPILAQP